MKRKEYFWLFGLIAAIIAIIVSSYLAICLVFGLLWKADAKGHRIDTLSDIAGSAQTAFGISFPDDAELVCGYMAGGQESVYTVVFECPVDTDVINKATFSTKKADTYIYKLLGSNSSRLSKSYPIEWVLIGGYDENQDITTTHNAFYEDHSLPNERFDRVMGSLVVGYNTFSTLEYKLCDGKLVFRMWIQRR